MCGVWVVHLPGPSKCPVSTLVELIANQQCLVEPFSVSIGLSSLHGNGPSSWCVKAITCP